MLLNAAERPRWWNLLVYGRSGTGKTSLGVTAPEPVVLLGELQGYESIRDAAHRLDKPEPPTFLIRTADELRRAIMTLRSVDDAPLTALAEQHGAAGVELPYVRPQTVVVDSLTEMMKLVCDEIDEQSPPRIAKDGLPERTKRFWGVLGNRSDRLLRALRDLPYHVVMLARLVDKEVGEGQEKSRLVTPDMPMNKLGELTASVTNAVGISTKVAKAKLNADTEYTFGVRFSGPGYFLLKALRPLGDVETSDVSDWIERLDRAHE